jgi:hypothetical protein
MSNSNECASEVAPWKELYAADGQVKPVYPAYPATAVCPGLYRDQKFYVVSVNVSCPTAF